MITELSSTELALYDPDRDSFWGIEGPFVELWCLLSEPKTIEMMVEKMLAEYEAPSSVIEKDVRDFIMGAVDEGLIEVLKN